MTEYTSEIIRFKIGATEYAVPIGEVASIDLNNLTKEYAKILAHYSWYNVLKNQQKLFVDQLKAKLEEASARIACEERIRAAGLKLTAVDIQARVVLHPDYQQQNHRVLLAQHELDQVDTLCAAIYMKKSMLELTSHDKRSERKL